MSEHILIGLGAVIVLGIAAQWLAWRLHLPAILLLLLCGILAGPVSGILDPDEVFGPLLFPLVSISVAIVLFEGGLSLRFSEVKEVRGVVIKLVTVGALVTWILAGAAGLLLTDMSFEAALLIGAILVVTGPTVIIPLLRQVRPSGRVGAIVKWEGIVNDPIGAILAVLVFEVILAGGVAEGFEAVIFAVLKAVVGGSITGLLGAGAIVLLLRRYLVPDFLQNPVALMLVVVTYLAANGIQTEAGLLAVTVMGVALANQKYVSIRHILEFKENLRVLLIASLFVILAARLNLADMELTSIGNWLFVALLIVLVRPLSVLAATAGGDLNQKEKIFVAAMAPRGIVAAAVTSVFVLKLEQYGISGFDSLVPIMFHVILITVAFYGLTASPLSRKLKLSRSDPQGVLFAGAHSWAREMAKVLVDEGVKVTMVDSNWSNVKQARSMGIRAQYGNILSEDMLSDLQLDGIGRLMALTPNDEVNALTALHFVDLFGRSEVYQLPSVGLEADSDSRSKSKEVPRHLRGRYLFGLNATYYQLTSLYQRGFRVKRTSITEGFRLLEVKKRYGDETIPLFVIREGKALVIWTEESEVNLREGDLLVSLADPSVNANDNGE